MGASLKFSENGDPDGLLSRNRSDSSPSQAASGFHLDVTQTREAMTMTPGKLSGHRVDVEFKSETQDIQRVPFFDGYAGGANLEGTASGILSNRATANGLGEMALPSNHWKSAANPQDPQTIGRIADGGQDSAFLSGNYGGNTVWASKSTHNAPSSSSQIMNETSHVSGSAAASAAASAASAAAGFGVKAAVTERKEAAYSGVQSLGSQSLAMPEKITAPEQASSLPRSPPPSSSPRVAAFGTLGKNPAHASVSPASELSRMTSNSPECKSQRGPPRLEGTGKDKHSTMALSSLPQNCDPFIVRSPWGPGVYVSFYRGTV